MKIRAVILAGGEGSRLGRPDRQARQAGRAFRRQVPDHRLHAVQLRQLGHRRRDDPDAVPTPLPERAHRGGPAVGPRPQFHRRDPDVPAVPRPRGHRLVQGDGRRDHAEPLLRGTRTRRTSSWSSPGDHIYKMDYEPLDLVPRRAQRGRHDRDVERDARRGHADGDPRDRRRASRAAVRREAEGPSGDARLDGDLRLRPGDAGADAARRTAGAATPPTTSARTSSRAWSTKGMQVYAFPFNGYWVDVGTVEAYWKTHMDLLKTPPPARSERPHVDHSHAVGGAPPRAHLGGRAGEGQHDHRRLRHRARGPHRAKHPLPGRVRRARTP